MQNPSDALKRAAKENAEALNSSGVFLLMFNPSMIEETIPLLQMGLAVYLDKPILILCPLSMAPKIPHNMVRMAQGFETYPDGNKQAMEAATHRLLDGLERNAARPSPET